MAINSFIDVSRFIFSYQKPENGKEVSENVLRFTIQTTLATVSAAIIHAIVNRCLKKQGSEPALSSQLLNASLMIAATSAAVFIFSLYHCVQDHKKGKDSTKVNRDIRRFERAVAVISLFGATAAFACTFLKRNGVLRSIATRTVYPLLMVTATAALIELFHLHQLSLLKTDKRD